MSSWLIASFRRVGSRLMRKNTTSVRHSMVSAMTPRRRMMKLSTVSPPPFVFWGCVFHWMRGVRRPLASFYCNSGFEPHVVQIDLEGLMHAVVLYLRRRMIDELAPVGLDDDARILDVLFDLGHHVAALVGIGHRQRLVDHRVEFLVGIGGLVPRRSGAIG